MKKNVLKTVTFQIIPWEIFPLVSVGACQETQDTNGRLRQNVPAMQNISCYNVLNNTRNKCFSYLRTNYLAA
jgi:hypothetical protein